MDISGDRHKEFENNQVVERDHDSASVSIIMLTIDRPQFIGSAIESVLCQSFKSWELLIVHDGVDPRIEPAVRPWMKKDSRIRYLHRSEKKNIANAINYGILNSRGKYVAILDDDDAWIHPHKIRLQVECLDSRPEVACVGGGAVVVDGSGKELMRYKKPMDDLGCRRNALLANPVIHSTVMFRRNAAEIMGFYDDTLQGYQDWDLWLKIMKRWEIANLSEYFTTYRVWDGGGSSRNVQNNAWSEFRIINRHRGYYPHYSSALVASTLYLCFALLPKNARKKSYQVMSKIKKRLFQG